MASGSDVIKIALQQKGISGRPNKFTNWYGMNDQWCAMFVSWCCNQAGVPTSIVPKTAAVQEFWNFAKSHGQFKTKGSGYKPVAGDIFIQKSNGASHTGFVVTCGGNTFVSIEGNCGNAVKECTHSMTEAALTGFFHPAYTEKNTSIQSSPGYSVESADTAEVKPEKKEITKTVVKGVNGTGGIYRYTRLSQFETGDDTYFELIIENDTFYKPIIVGEPTLAMERSGSPSVLKFTVLKDEILNFQEGNPVKLRINGKPMFYGYVFSKSRKDNVTIDVTAYDQLRYFKNKDSYIYENKKYSELLKMICEDYNLKLGSVADTEYVIPQRVEDGTLFDILGNASDETIIRTGKLFVLYDDYGSITLKNILDMQTDFFIDEAQLQGYDYKTSIDSDVYNRVKLAYDNEETGEREFYITNGTENQSKWGILQYYDTVDNTGDVTLRGKMLLNYYNVKGRTLKLNNVFGSTDIRGGSSVIVKLNLGDIIVSNRMLVEKVTHKFSGGHHFMDLNLSGIRGEFS